MKKKSGLKRVCDKVGSYFSCSLGASFLYNTCKVATRSAKKCEEYRNFLIVVVVEPFSVTPLCAIFFFFFCKRVLIPSYSYQNTYYRCYATAYLEGQELRQCLQEGRIS